VVLLLYDIICYYEVFESFSYISSSTYSFGGVVASRVCLVLNLDASLLMCLSTAYYCIVRWSISYFFPLSLLEDLGCDAVTIVEPLDCSTVPYSQYYYY
jgi:hypothetical protein